MSVLPLPTKEVYSLEGHEGPILSTRFNQEGNYCLSTGQDRTIRLWNPHRGTSIKTYKGHSYEVYDVAVTHDNAKIASCGGDKQVFLWDVATGKIIRKLRGHSSRINTCVMNDESTLLVSGSYDQTMRVFDLRSNSADAIQTMDDFKDSVTCVALSGTYIIGGCVDGTVRTYDVRSGRLTTDHIGGPVTCVTLSKDKNCILTSTLDNSVRLIDKQLGEMLSEYRGHQNSKYKVQSCFSNTDAYVISGSEDNNIFFWDLVDANIVHRLSGHEKAVVSLSYHPTETCLISGSVDGTVRVWK